MICAEYDLYPIHEKYLFMNRRQFIQASTILASDLIMQPLSAAKVPSKATERWFMPEESEPHLRTWMAFGANAQIWGKALLPKVQQDLALLAKTIAQYEPVSMLVNQKDYHLAQKLVGPTVKLINCPLDDLWIRDTGPVFVLTEQGKKSAINFNFNGWGKKQTFLHDAKVAHFVVQQAHVTSIKTNLILEGGAIEVDGYGTAIITESCIINKNRNAHLTKTQIETELKTLLGLEKIIWLPGIKGKDITDGHTDFYARFIKPGVVVVGFESDPASFDHAVTQKHLQILRSSTDARGKKLEIVVIKAPQAIRNQYVTNDFAAEYINFYVCNGAVIAPEFGDKYADAAAKSQLKQLFPNRDIVQLNIDGIAAGGGGIHCATQQEPRV